MKKSWENYKIQHSDIILLKLVDGNIMVETEGATYQEVWWVLGIRILVKCRNIFYVKESSIGEEQFMVEEELGDVKMIFILIWMKANLN